MGFFCGGSMTQPKNRSNVIDRESNIFFEITSLGALTNPVLVAGSCDRTGFAAPSMSPFYSMASAR